MTKGTDDGRIDLPSGNWVKFRDPKSVTNRERRPLMEHAEEETAEGAGLVRNLSFAERLVALMVGEWSYPHPLPSAKPEVLDDLPALDLDTMMQAVILPEHSPFLATGKMADPKA